VRNFGNLNDGEILLNSWINYWYF